MFVLFEHGRNGYTKEYYVGKTYILQGEIFPYIANHEHEAKRYTSRKRAELACVKLNEKTGRNFGVEAIELSI